MGQTYKLPSTGDKIRFVGVDLSSGQDETAEVTIEVDRFGRISVIDVRYIPSTPPRDEEKEWK